MVRMPSRSRSLTDSPPTPGRASTFRSRLVLLRRDAEQTRWFYEDVLGLPLVAWQARIDAAGVSSLGPVDHGFVKSVYQTLGDRAAAPSSLQQWSRRMRALKKGKFGAEAIDRRQRRPASRPDAAAKPQ